MKSLLFVFILFNSYPDSWWQEIPTELAYDWEILPQAAQKSENEVILSKRTELGILSNFAHTPFYMDGHTYQSLEGFWQMMKYPDPTDENDPRNLWANEYAYTRLEVMSMVAFEAKAAGDLANKINKSHHVYTLSYKHRHFNHKDYAEGTNYHYQLIRKATEAKVDQNAAVRNILFKTGKLFLKPDHITDENDPPAYKYYEILMEIRDTQSKKY